MTDTPASQFALKPGVQMHGVQPEAVLGMFIVSSVLAAHNQTCTITSITDLAPGRLQHSKHRIGLAFDLRIWNLGPSEHGLQEWRKRFQEALGDEWDVVLKPDHMHFEFDPTAV